MRITKLTLATLVAAGALFTSCDNDDDITTPPPVKKGDTLTSDAKLYKFTRDGESTVSFGGQTTRLKQVAEIGSLLGDTSVTLVKLNKMFKEGKEFKDATLVNGKKIRSKTANSVGLFKGGTTSASDIIKTDFDAYLKEYIENVQASVKAKESASEGKPGIADTKRNVNSDGLEYNQAFYKGLIGALVVDQVSNHYFNRLDDNFDNSNAYRKAHDSGEVKEGKYYTTMEHHWDEAYGYVYGVDVKSDVLLQKYIARVEQDADFKGIANKIYSAFGKGRKAIVDKNYEERDAQIAIIRKEIANVVAIRAVHYLQAGKAKLATREKAFHALSEGYGFVYSLQFLSLDGETPIFTKAVVDGYIKTLEKNNGFWDVTAGQLDKMSNEIASKFAFTVAQTLDNDKK